MPVRPVPVRPVPVRPVPVRPVLVRPVAVRLVPVRPVLGPTGAGRPGLSPAGDTADIPGEVARARGAGTAPAGR